MVVKLGIFVVPDASDPASTLEQIVAGDRCGLDLVGVQDHPYQRRFFDTWMLLSFAAARTERIQLVTDVANLPLRPPAMLAKAAASLDLLSGGRFELGLGAGAFWDAVEAMGGSRRTPKESVDALEEAMAILRAFWAAGDAVTLEGHHYTVKGAKPGPPPAHPIGIWLGAYGPRMLRLTGRLANGWLPSLGGRYLTPDDAPRRHAIVDEAAREAGREPSAVERAVNVMALAGDPQGWPEQLARVVELGFTTLLVGLPSQDAPAVVRRLGEDVRPRLLELVG
jgi:alkanesulfonate monooxygenase SsuD/methylene tetrahydromethanopterin reductase-like flavin-dependent oxidoreductase (luciferase family)